MGLRMIWSAVLILALWTDLGSGTDSIHTDTRCICKCPDVSIVSGAHNSAAPVVDKDSELRELEREATRSIYINSNVTPDDCGCREVVLVKLNLTETQAESFCPRCHCKYQVRSLTTIKVVVIIVAWIISILVIYMTFLSCLDPILSKRISVRGPSVAYREQRDDDGLGSQMEQPATDEGPFSSTQMRPLSTRPENVIHRIGHQQSKWQKQVQEQRKNIYDRHNMLN